VDEPAQVEVEEFDDQGETVLELKVAPNDVGKVIGKQGRTVRSMRRHRQRRPWRSGSG
jgi:uncharacterized protein